MQILSSFTQPCSVLNLLFAFFCETQKKVVGRKSMQIFSMQSKYMVVDPVKFKRTKSSIKYEAFSSHMINEEKSEIIGDVK